MIEVFYHLYQRMFGCGKEKGREEETMRKSSLQKDIRGRSLLRHRGGCYFVLYAVCVLAQWSTRTLPCKYAIFTSFKKEKVDDGRGTTKESHREVLIHKMPRLGNRTPGHMGEEYTDWLESQTLPWKQTMQPYEAYYFLPWMGMLQLI